VLLPLTRWFLAPKKKEGAMHDSGKTLDQLVKEYGLSDNLFRLKAIADSEAIGKTVVDLDVHRKYGINILEIRRDNGSQHRFLRTVTQQLASSEPRTNG
jgi:Trk K+ transport system NAD-binding subunit